MNTEHTEVSSLAEYLAWTKDVLPSTDGAGHTLFYRGHADADYVLEPTAYRTDGGKSFRAVEHHLYEELLRLDPVAFSADKSVFERLVRMQHHGLPTRLLDLTHSPLIALYFACSGGESKNGEVMFFPWKREEVHLPSDIPDTSLAGVREQADFTAIGKDIVGKLKAFLSDETKHGSGHADFDKSRQAIILLAIIGLDAALEADFLIQSSMIQAIEEKFLKELYLPWSAKLDEARMGAGPTDVTLALTETVVFLERFRNRLSGYTSAIIDSLCSKLKIENNSERGSLGKFLWQFTHFHFVYAPVNNERIRRQQGAFIICPPAKSDFWKAEQHRNPRRVRIRHDAKQAILSELAHLGITRSYIFPELTELASEARLRYPAR